MVPRYFDIDTIWPVKLSVLDIIGYTYLGPLGWRLQCTLNGYLNGVGNFVLCCQPRRTLSRTTRRSGERDATDWTADVTCSTRQLTSTLTGGREGRGKRRGEGRVMGGGGEGVSPWVEIGRAGRDGLDSRCHVFYSPADFNTNRWEGGEREEEGWG